ncbi:MAG: hypothetical protein JSW39_09930, partial [Desulfobacterales bacterium]
MQDFKNDYSNFQEGIRRLERALKGIPDRVPVMAQLHEFALKELHVNARDFYTTPDFLPAGTLAIMEKYGIDVPFLDYDVYNIEAEAIGQRIIYGDHNMPDVDRSHPLIHDRNDLKKIKTPNFASDGRFAVVVEINRRFNELIGAEQSLSFCAPFSLAANIRGIDQLIMDILLDPDFDRELFERITEELLAPWILYLKETFPG